jgi:coenzyme PQQ biosynthesis protein PqqD
VREVGHLNQMSFDEQSCPSLARGVRLQTDGTTGEPVLLFPEGVLFLSPTAKEILSRCDGQTSVASILSSLAEEYDAEGDTLRRDLLECLADLHQRKLVVC